MKIKKLNEITASGNPAIPGDPDYLKHIKGEAERGLRERNIRNSQQAAMRLMQLCQQVVGLQRGKETRLEELAEKIIRLFYKAIIENVDLDIKFTRPGKLDQEGMEPGESCDKNFKKLTDEDLKAAIYARKIANNIMQGEAKNTHRIIHTDEVKTELDRIDARLFPIYDEILKINEFFDWMIPIEFQKQMWKEHPEGMSGKVKVEWPDKNNDEEEQEKAEDALKEEDLGEDAENLLDDGSPKIIARGVDLPMLIHETVKGIYELIAAKSIPDDSEKAKTILLNTDTMFDEIEDLRNGPFIAGDLRDFVNENSKSDDIQNLREFVFGNLMDIASGDPRKFLKIMKGILLSKIATKPEHRVDIAYSRKAIDEIIDEIAEGLSTYDEFMRGEEEDKKAEQFFKDEEDEDTLDSPEEEIEEEPITEPVDKKIEQTDFASMPKPALRTVADKAFNNDDWDTFYAAMKHLDFTALRKYNKREINLISNHAIDDGKYDILQKLSQLD